LIEGQGLLKKRRTRLTDKLRELCVRARLVAEGRPADIKLQIVVEESTS
jgi:hypothetical protein